MVVFHVAGGQVFGRGVIKLGKQILGQLAQGVDQHVETAPVRHADHDLLHALRAGLLDHLVHGGNEALAALQRETLLAHVLGVQETLQTLGGGQAVQDVFFLVGGEHRLAADRFQLFLPPALLRLVADEHVLGTNGAAVSLAQCIEQVAQRHHLFAEEGVAGVKHGFKIRISKTVKRRVQLRNVFAVGALERVEVGPARTHVAVSGNQLLNRDALTTEVGVGASGDDHPGATLLGAVGKRVDDGKMGHVASVGSVHGRHMLQRVEVRTPRLRHTAWIGQVVFVHLFHVRRVAAEEVRVALVGNIDVAGCGIAHEFAGLRFPAGN